MNYCTKMIVPLVIASSLLASCKKEEGQQNEIPVYPVMSVKPGNKTLEIGRAHV